MEENTTTEAPAEAGAQEAQPVEVAQAEAVQETTTPVQNDDKGHETSSDEPSEDDLINDFAAKKGLELDSPGARKAAKMAMEAEKLMHKATGRASELEKSMSQTSDDYAEQVAQQTGQDPEVLKRLQRMEVKDAVRDFWNTPDENGSLPDRSLETKMVELVKSRPHLAADLDSLYATAMVKSGRLNSVKTQGKREALESLAHKQQAAVPTGAATNPVSTPKEKPFNELSIPEMEAKLGYARR